MVFLGEFQVSFNGSGRLVLPKKIRELLDGDIFILTKGFDANLSGFDKKDWEHRADELLNVSLLEQENLSKRRFLFSATIHVEIDEQGRFIIPKHLLQFAELTDKATIIGVGDHFEIWNQEKWSQYLDKVES